MQVRGDQPTHGSLAFIVAFLPRSQYLVSKNYPCKQRFPEWKIAMGRSKIKAMERGRVEARIAKIERNKAQIRARFEDAFRTAKRFFGYNKVRFEGLAKNTSHIVPLFALANLH